jgi:hypothetical protein
MDDNNKTVNPNAASVAQDDQIQSQTQVQPVQPVVPAGSLNKEAGPINAPASELIKPSETEPQISEDLKELGIEAKKDEPRIADEHKGLVEHAKQFSPISMPPSGKIVMPMSEEEIEKQLKTGQDDDSGKWFARLIKKIIAWGFNSE